MWARALLAVAAALLAGGCGHETAARPAAEQAPERPAAPERPLRFDERAGSFRGLRLRDTQAEVRARLGPARCSTVSPIEPLGEDYYEIGGPTGFRPPRGEGPGRDCHMRYRRLVVFLFSGGVHGFATTEPRARTLRGVGPGDPSARVPERYRGARCEIANEGTEYATFPLCTVTLEPGRRLYFGGDPIRSVWLIVTRRSALN